MNVRQENYRIFLFFASSFSFPHSENCHIIFVFNRLFFPQPWKLFIFALEAWQTSLPLSLRRLQQVSKLLGINLSGKLEETKRVKKTRKIVYPKDLRKEWKAKGWILQVLILDYKAIGAFVTHWGWNSTLEGIRPIFAEQFYNEKLVTDVLKVGAVVEYIIAVKVLEFSQMWWYDLKTCKRVVCKSKSWWAHDMHNR